jgi:cellulose synthase/poly-beta-1,6-N-acetylglucosamine synthase-like glycosyltransferase
MMVVIEVLLLVYFIYVVLYTATFALGGFLYKTPLSKTTTEFKTFAVLIPSYKEDSVILEVAAKAIQQNYPSANFKVYVIADSLQQTTIELLKKLPIGVIEVFFDKSTKVKSLNQALARISDVNYDYAVILDADNVMEIDFLKKMNALIGEKGYQAIQGQRKPKNQNNNLAFLDGVSEAINNPFRFYQRLGRSL